MAEATPTPTTTTTTRADQRELVEPGPANLAPVEREIEVKIDRSKLRIGDLRFMKRFRRHQHAVFYGQPLPADHVTDEEIYELWDRVIVGGSAALDELPLEALGEVWNLIDAAVSGQTRPARKNL